MSTRSSLPCLTRLISVKPDDNWRTVKTITTRMLRWTITDTCLFGDARFLLYSTISSVLHLVKIQGDDSVADSQANITEIHVPILIGGEDGM